MQPRARLDMLELELLRDGQCLTGSGFQVGELPVVVAIAAPVTSYFLLVCYGALDALVGV
eukprot:1365332-Amorphochlora_amoeboformis.AAC.1